MWRGWGASSPRDGRAQSLCDMVREGLEKLGVSLAFLKNTLAAMGRRDCGKKHAGAEDQAGDCDLCPSEDQRAD